MNTKAHSVHEQRPETFTTQTPAVQVKQAELVKFIGLKNQITKLTEEKDVLETELKNLLTSGASVEEGTHIAKAELASRTHVAWREGFENLADKLRGKGEGAKLAERVLENTEPTTYVKLTVK